MRYAVVRGERMADVQTWGLPESAEARAEELGEDVVVVRLVPCRRSLSRKKKSWKKRWL
jgi:hypothetical protein